MRSACAPAPVIFMVVVTALILVMPTSPARVLAGHGCPGEAVSGEPGVHLHRHFDRRRLAGGKGSCGTNSPHVPCPPAGWDRQWKNV
jgi:hypothetical protein